MLADSCHSCPHSFASRTALGRADLEFGLRTRVSSTIWIPAPCGFSIPFCIPLHLPVAPLHFWRMDAFGCEITFHLSHEHREEQKKRAKHFVGEITPLWAFGSWVVQLPLSFWQYSKVYSTNISNEVPILSATPVFALRNSSLTASFFPLIMWLYFKNPKWSHIWFVICQFLAVHILSYFVLVLDWLLRKPGLTTKLV